MQAPARFRLDRQSYALRMFAPVSVRVNRRAAPVDGCATCQGLSEGLVEVGAVGQFSFYRSWHHQNFRRVGWGPHRHNSQSPNSARLSDQNARINSDLFRTHSAQSSDPSGDNTKEGINTNRSRDSSDFDFAKVLARDRSRAAFRKPVKVIS